MNVKDEYDDKHDKDDEHGDDIDISDVSPDVLGQAYAGDDDNIEHEDDDDGEHGDDNDNDVSDVSPDVHESGPHSETRLSSGHIPRCSGNFPWM